MTVDPVAYCGVMPAPRNLTLPRANLTMPDGSRLTRVRFIVKGDAWTILDRRGQTVDSGSQVVNVEPTSGGSRATWRIDLADGSTIIAAKAGCNCGG